MASSLKRPTGLAEAGDTLRRYLERARAKEIRTQATVQCLCQVCRIKLLEEI